MSKAKSVFACQTCGHHTTKWLGRCPDCGGWNTLTEEVQAPSRPARQQGMASAQLPLPLTEIARSGEERLLTGIGELDRVLGGGLVRGSLVLIGGDPGIGKSTLLLQATAGLSRGRTAEQHPVLYVSGEESATQLRMMAARSWPSSPLTHRCIATRRTVMPAWAAMVACGCLATMIWTKA